MTNVNSVDSDIKMTGVIFRSCNVLQSESFRGQKCQRTRGIRQGEKGQEKSSYDYEKNALKEKDRLRRAMKKTSHVDGRTLP